MFYKLLFLACFFGISDVAAQEGITPVKTTEKPADPQIDYEQPGAPMPLLRFIPYHNNAGKKDTLAAKKGRNKKERKLAAEMSQPALTNEDLDNHANLFVIIFNPNCVHCQEEAAMLGSNQGLFKKTKVVFLANPIMKQYMGDFISFTRFGQYPFLLGMDSSDFTKKVFLYHALPQINIYDKKRRLLKVYSGDVPIDSLKKYIQ